MGSYRVYARWPGNSTHSAKASYTVVHAAGQSEIRLDQRQDASDWAYLGTYKLTPTSTVTLKAQDDGMVVADAIKVVNTSADSTIMHYVYSDHLNTPRVIINTANQERWRWLGEPFGTATPEENPGNAGVFKTSLRLPGQLYDEESALHYNTYRDYDPATGRYIQSDPIGLAGGINTYSYVGGDPLSISDPRGLDNPGMGPYGPYWTGVQLCSRPVNISWVGAAGAYLPQHNWVQTGTYEAGMGARCPVLGQGCSDRPGAQTQTLDHSGQSSQPDATCRPIPNVDEQCVSNAIRPARKQVVGCLGISAKASLNL